MRAQTHCYPRIDNKRKKIILVSILLLSMVQQSINGQIISTVVGTGLYGYTGDGGQAASATLKSAEIVVLDASGNMYISGDASHTVRKVTVSTGIITTIAGNGTSGNTGDGGPATSAELSYPMGLAFDASGNLYIADFYNMNIRKVDATTGIIATVAGNGTTGFSGDGGPATAAEFYYPFGIATDSDDNIYISDLKNSRIRKVTASTGIITTIAGNGTARFSGDGGPATSAEINFPQIIVLDNSNNIYIADQENNRVRLIDASTGIITTIAGNGTGGFSGDGGPATAAELNFPTGLAFDKAGNLYIGDQNNKRVRKITKSTGFITTVAGNGTSGFSGDGGPATAAKLSFLDGVAVDANGAIYIADTGNNRIRKVTPSTGLPIDLITFHATVDDLDQSVNLTWQTTSENNSDYFILERGIDGFTFQSIDRIAAAVTSDALIDYYFTDKTPIDGLAYYRLKEIDADGKISLSSIVTAKRNDVPTFLIYPNPVQNDLHISSSSTETNKTTLSIIDVMGRILYQKESIAKSQTIPMEQFGQGIYFLKIDTENKNVITQKIIKKE
jgi:sugar lactone lactonase YvrE